MSAKYMELLDKCRNLVPVISIEGGREKTDSRRGEGVYDKIISVMDEFNSRGLIYGVSVTVTKENLSQVFSDDFLDLMRSRGCKAVFYIEFVPVTDEASDLAPDDDDRDFMMGRIAELRSSRQDMVYISFPGDEKSSGGCLAAGRGFFHINSHGGAEPCPFSPYSDINVRDTSLREALQSRLFTELRDGGILAGDHIGGCVLHAKKDQVEALLRQ
jgi:MoaA/NifB/PqqE/SkfB family radical SAM enzyme